MGAHRRSRIVQRMGHATVAVVILATALLPLISPEIAARGKDQHGHGQHQATERGTESGRHHPQVASASKNKKRHTDKKKGGHQPGLPAQPGSIFNPPSPTAPSRHSYTETRTFTASCIAYPEPEGDGCSVDLVEFLHSTPVQIEATPTLPCGRATVSATGWITGSGDVQVLERQDIPSGISTGVIDLGTVKSFSIGMRITNFEGCGPIPRTGWAHTMSVTYSYTTPTPVPVLTP